VLTSYDLTHQSVQQFVVSMHTEWFATIDPALSRALGAPLLVQDRADREQWVVGAFSGRLNCGCFAVNCVRCLDNIKRPSLLSSTALVSSVICCPASTLLAPKAHARSVGLICTQYAPQGTPTRARPPTPPHDAPPPPQAAFCPSTLPGSCCR
jgi:hypothetical protein